MTKIKICGITRLADISILNETGIDIAGFVFSQSPRQINVETARALRSFLDKKIKTSGVFVNENPYTIAKLANQKIIDIAQLHGDEDNNYIKSLRKLTNCTIVKAVRVQTSQQIIKLQHTDCDYLLLDTFSNKVYGGSGKSFDWGIIPTKIKPYFLAGGLNSENVTSAIKLLSPYCVDVSSGVETNHAKDRDKIINFVNQVRSCEQ